MTEPSGADRGNKQGQELADTSVPHAKQARRAVVLTRGECLRLATALAFSALTDACLGAGADASSSAGLRYLDWALRVLRRLQEQTSSIRRAGQAVAEGLLGGHKLYVWDAEGAVTSEALGRAGGFMAVHALANKTDGVRGGDVLILASRAPREERALSIVLKAKSAGCGVIVLAPAGALTAAGSYSVDLPVPEGDAVVEVRGASGRLGPTSGLACCAALWAVLAEAALAMAEKGKPPHLWMSIKLPEAASYNDRALKQTADLGY
ncbi:MAG: hypothetical protein ACUVRO_13040 [Armatimonadota bacterium]